MNHTCSTHSTSSSFDFYSLYEQLTYVKIDNEVGNALKDLKQMLYNKILDEHQYAIYYSKSEKLWISYVPDETKKDKRRRIKRKSKANLEKYLIEFYSEKKRKEAHDNISLQDLYEKWLLFRRDFTPTKSKTIYENIMDWNKFFKDTSLSQMRVKDITPKILMQFFRSITKDRLYTYKRISNARSVLSGIMYYAIEEDIITHNPVLDVNFKLFAYKPVANQSFNVYTQEDTIKLLTYLSDIDEPYALAIQLFFYLFIRIGELKAIRFEDIDFSKKTLYLHSQALLHREMNDDLTFSSRDTVVVNQMKGNTENGFRIQELTDEAIIIIRKAMLLNPKGTFLFEPNGKILSTDRFNRKLKKYCEACNVPYYPSHKIRFYNASTAYDGKNLSTISTLMGHSQVTTTLHYLRNVKLTNETTLAFKKLGLSAQKIKGSKGLNSFKEKK